MRDEREPERAADDRGDRLHECDLLVAEALRGPGAVQVQQPPSAAAGVERGAQLCVDVHQRPQLAPPRAALRAPPGGGVQVGDLPRGAREVAELVEVGHLELVLPEWPAHAVRHSVRDPGAEPEQRVRVRRGHDKGVDGQRRAELLGDALDEALGRQLLGGERVDPSHRSGEVAGDAR
jgi:hypothetical protein